jgi:hypothetical protein
MTAALKHYRLTIDVEEAIMLLLLCVPYYSFDRAGELNEVARQNLSMRANEIDIFDSFDSYVRRHLF